MNDTQRLPDLSPALFAASPPDVTTLARHITATGCAAAALQAAADTVRRDVHGDTVFLRGIIEFSNCCRNHCAYCGINADNELVERYRMTPEEILRTARDALRWGCTTVVLQSGDDPGFGLDTLAASISEVRLNAGPRLTR